ncbi:MAG: NADH-quinone oxidoreductase subunit N [Anaerolineae bacterium]|nr:NADH-quinone oxidoreductase subunit N [Anaerolineae bacterium]
MFELPSLASLNLTVTLPALSLVIGAVVLVVVELLLPARRRGWIAWLALLGVGVSLVLSLLTFYQGGEAFGGMFMADTFTSFLNVTVLTGAGLSILLAMDYLRRAGIEHRTDYYLLLLFITAGMMFMGAANDLIVIFVALELLSIPLYVLSGIRRPDPKSEEAALKYFLLGAFSSGFLVYGIALIYGATGTTSLPGIWLGASAIIEGGTSGLFTLLLGAGLIMVSLGFKVAAVPFHMWTPDVYEGAPTSVTAFMSVGTKAASFAALLRILVVGLPTLILAEATAAAWVDSLAILALLTMILGNLVAIWQDNIKRLLAYSSIAHAGYILIAVAAAGQPDIAERGVQAALVYLLAYTFTNLGAFAVVIALEKNDGSGIMIDDFAGLGRQRPGLALLMTLFMFSLAGIPLTAGFVGKWYVFLSGVDAGLVWLAVIGVITSVFAVYYYLRVVVKMFLQEGDSNIAMPRLPRTLAAALILAAAGTLIFGLFPDLMANMSGDVNLAGVVQAMLR